MKRMILAATAICCVTTAWAEGEYAGVQAGDARLAVVDVHLHTGEWDMMPPAFHERIGGQAPQTGGIPVSIQPGVTLAQRDGPDHLPGS